MSAPAGRPGAPFTAITFLYYDAQHSRHEPPGFSSTLWPGGRQPAGVGLDYYASASSDKIDQVMSSPSSHDVRYHADFGLAHVLADKLTTLGAGAGVSKEYDYLSFNILASWARSSQDGNRQLSVSGQAFFDKVTLITTAELRVGGTRNKNYGSDSRQTINLSVVYAQVLSKRLQVKYPASVRLTYYATDLVQLRGFAARLCLAGRIQWLALPGP